jgi:hypothetical protein
MARLLSLRFDFIDFHLTAPKRSQEIYSRAAPSMI